MSESAFSSFWYVCLNKNYSQIVGNCRSPLFFSFWYVAIVWIKIVLKMSGVRFFQILASCYCESNSQNIGGPLFSPSGM